jgi:hypothetical protein
MNSRCSNVYTYVILSTTKLKVATGDDTFSQGYVEIINKIIYICQAFQLTFYRVWSSSK